MTAPIDKQPSNEIENILIWVAGQGRMNRVKQAHSAITKIINEARIEELERMQLPKWGYIDAQNDYNIQLYLKSRISVLTKDK